jgi:Tfp pilus assembly protein PilE
MVVVIIIGILAAVAIPAYQRHAMRVRAQEALTLLSQIRLKQLQYYSEFRTYVQADFNPTSATYPCGGSQKLWQSQTAWTTLGFKPSTRGVYFQYWTRQGVGTPSSGDPLQTCGGLIDGSKHYPNGGNWFVACARGDLLGSNCTSPGSAPTWMGISGSDNYGRVLTKGMP